MRMDLTDLQMRQLVATLQRIAAGRAMFTHVELGQVQRLIGELQELRNREAVSRHLASIEAIV